MTPQDQMSAFCSREGQHGHNLMAAICARRDVSLLQHAKAARGGQADRVWCTWLPRA